MAAATGLAVAAAALVLVQAFAVADLVVGPFQQGADLAALRPALLVLAGVVLGRGLLAWATEISAHRAAAGSSPGCAASCWNTSSGSGRHGSPGRPPGTSRRSPRAARMRWTPTSPATCRPLVAATIVPPVVVAAITAQDLLAGLVVLVTLPLVPVFAVLVGLATQRRTRHQWGTLSTLGAHFLDVVQGLPTLLVFRRAQAQVAAIRRVTEENRRATMATLRLAFLSSAVLEFVATLSVALVAVSTGLRLVSGSLDLHTGLVVLVLAPEAYLPLRQVGAQFHASADGLAAAERVFAVLDTPARQATTRRPLPGRPGPATIRVEALT